MSAARRTALFALLLPALLAGQGCFAPRRVVRRYTVHAVPARDIIRDALSQLGKPYAFGGRDPHSGFDCAGLVYWCYSQHGCALPVSAHLQYRLGVPVPRNEIRPGDLVFFDTASGVAKPAHVGIMVNHERFIHSPASGEYVREDELSNNYWKKSFYGARRIE